VLDLSRVLAGPWSGQLLADYGADVIKVERPGPATTPGPGARPGSATRPSACRPTTSAATAASARWRWTSPQPKAPALVRELAADADVLLENYKVGQLAKYGLDYASCAALNPRLVYCSITGFGQDGPYAQPCRLRLRHPGHRRPDERHRREGRHAGSQPQKVGVAVADLFTGVYATTAILAALRRARPHRPRPPHRRRPAGRAGGHAGQPGQQLPGRRHHAQAHGQRPCQRRALPGASPRATATSCWRSATTASSHASASWPARPTWRATRAT
jgi:hypothetical protein